MIFDITSLEPKTKCLGRGRFALNESGLALILHENGKTALAKLTRARVEWAAAEGIMISGFEETGTDKTGRPKFRFQRWSLRYPDRSH